MAMISAAILQALRTTWRKEYQNGLETTAPQWERIASLIKSTSASNTYGFLGQFPRLREWVGDRQHKSMKEHGYAITNKKFEGSVEVARDDIEDDNLGQYSLMFESMGEAAGTHTDELVFTMLAAGFNTECYDGQYFFDTDHPVNNEVDGSGSDTMVSNIVDQGSYAGHPWYLLDTRRKLKPLIFQKRREYDLKSMTKLDDEYVYTKDSFRFGVDARVNVGFGFWQMGCAVRGDVNTENFEAAELIMTSMKADGGRPLAIKPNLLVCGPSNVKAAKRLIMSDEIGGEHNINQNTVEILEVPWLP